MKYKLIGAFSAILGLGGWHYYRCNSYGERNATVDTGIQVVSMIPGISIVITPPVLIGYGLAQGYDNLLYWLWPMYYQKLIDDFLKDNYNDNEYDGRGPSTGNPQITYFE